MALVEQEGESVSWGYCREPLVDVDFTELRMPQSSNKDSEMQGKDIDRA